MPKEMTRKEFNDFQERFPVNASFAVALFSGLYAFLLWQDGQYGQSLFCFVLCVAACLFGALKLNAIRKASARKSTSTEDGEELTR